MKKILLLICLPVILVSSCNKTNTKQVAIVEDEQSSVVESVSNEITEDDIYVDPLDLSGYKFYFNLEFGPKENPQMLKLPTTIGTVIDAGFTDMIGNEDLTLNPEESVNIIFKSAYEDTFTVIVSNPTNHVLNYRDIFVSGLVVDFTNENIRLYPSITDATQKYLYKDLGVEDSEIVMGEYSNWKGSDATPENVIPKTTWYMFGEDSNSPATVMLEYENEQLASATILYQKIGTIKDSD